MWEAGAAYLFTLFCGLCVCFSGHEMFDYILSLPAPVPWSIMSSPLGCCCLFRTLRPFDRHVLLRLLPLQQSVSERAMRLWVSAGNVAELRRALQRLSAARFIRTIEPPPASKNTAQQQQQGKATGSSHQHPQQRVTQYALTPCLQKTLLQVLMEGPPKFPLPFIQLPPKSAFPPKRLLLMHSQRKWERVLQFVVGASEDNFQERNDGSQSSRDLMTVRGEQILGAE